MQSTKIPLDMKQQSEMSVSSVVDKYSWQIGPFTWSTLDLPFKRKPTLHNRPDRWAIEPSLIGLPLEIIYLVFDVLDFKSLYSILRTSVAARLAVESFPVYRYMIIYGTGALTALNRSRLVTHHSASRLRRVLRSQACETCGLFGPFLYLPTCERSCLDCLEDDFYFERISMEKASAFFNLDTRHLRKLPGTCHMPAQYRAHEETGSSPHRIFTSLAHAKESAMQYHYSAEYVDNIVRMQIARELSAFEAQSSAHKLDPHGVPRPRKPRLASRMQAGIPNAPISMTFAPIPYVSAQGEQEHGLWCLGCDALTQLYPDSRVYRGEVICGQGITVPELMRRARLAWSTKEFLSHVKECPGVQVCINKGS